MADKTLVEYLRKVLAANQFNDRVKNSLIKNGWTNDEINQAFAEATSESLKNNSKKTRKAISMFGKIDHKKLILGTIIIAGVIIFTIFFIVYSNHNPATMSSNVGSSNLSSQSKSHPGKVAPESKNSTVNTAKNGTSQSHGGTSKVINKIDCGTDLACFNSSEKYCNQTTAINYIGGNVMGTIVNETTAISLNKTADKECNFTLKIINFTMRFSQETKQAMMMHNSSLTQEDIKNYEDNLTETAKSHFIGKSFTCILNQTSDLSRILETLKDSPESVTPLLENLNCTGSLMDVMSGGQ